MNIQSSKRGNVTVVRVHGTIILSQSGRELFDFMQELLEADSGSVLIDLTFVDEVDSTGLGELVGYLQRFSRKKRRLAVLNPTIKIRKLFEFSHLYKILPVFNNEDIAIASLDK